MGETHVHGPVQYSEEVHVPIIYTWFHLLISSLLVCFHSLSDRIWSFPGSILIRSVSQDSCLSFIPQGREDIKKSGSSPDLLIILYRRRIGLHRYLNLPLFIYFSDTFRSLNTIPASASSRIILRPPHGNVQSCFPAGSSHPYPIKKGVCPCRS